MKRILLVVALSVISSTYMYSQKLEIKNEETSFFEKNKALFGDVEIKSATREANGENTFRVFSVNAREAGDYYLDAWMSFPSVNGKCIEYEILINGVTQEGTLKSTTEGWQSASLTNARNSTASIKLKLGLNEISIKGIAPGIPNVEFVKLSKSLNSAGISNTEYREYYDGIKSQEESSRQKASPSKVAPSDTTNILMSRSVGTNGQEFNYTLNVPVKYTTYGYYDFTAGQTVTIYTSSNSYQHVIECFSASTPTSSSWGLQATGAGTLSFTVNQTGSYIIRFRAYRQLIDGLINYSIIVNNKLVESMNNCPVSGYGLVVPSGYNYSTDVNAFTGNTNSGADTYMWVQGSNNRILGYNDDFRGGGNFSWGWHSRINQGISGTQAVLFSAHRASAPATTCDVYVGLKNTEANTLRYFPLLNSIDAIRTAPSSGVYNCIAWSVGVTNDWHWPPSMWQYQSSTPLAAFDAYYRAYGFERAGANSSNGAIALWALNGSLTHASVRKNTISDRANRPHGFDWESKPGGLTRTTHTRDALAGNNSGDYGNIAYYYKPSSARTMSASNPISEIAELSSAELSVTDNVKSQLSNAVISEFEKLYSAWSKTWALPEVALNSDPRKYAESKEYSALVEFCNKYGKATWPLFIEKLNQGDIFNINLLEDLTIAENKNLLDEVKASGEIKSRSMNVVPTLRSNAINYAKKLLSKHQIEILHDATTKDFVDEIFDFSLSANSSTVYVNIDMKESANATIQIFDVYGNMIGRGVNKTLSAGKQTVSINVSSTTGVYVVNVTANNKTLSKKVSVQ